MCEGAHGSVCLVDLRKRLQRLSGASLIVGAFSAASNITGILADVDGITGLLHAHGALAVWDYATAGPYCPIDMHPGGGSSSRSSGSGSATTSTGSGAAATTTTANNKNKNKNKNDLNNNSNNKNQNNSTGVSLHKDAVLLSMHKFVGGPGAPGVLVASKSLFSNPLPAGGGGGSVFYVTRDKHRYLRDVEAREEGGTPDIVGAIRAGLTMQLKVAAGPSRIVAHCRATAARAVAKLKEVPGIVLLGNTSASRLSIISFMVRHAPSNLYLHHNYVCALLNDLFGVQARGGCACAGPYAQDLLGIDPDLADRFEALLLEDPALDRTHLRRVSEYSSREVLRPGFARLNLPWWMEDSAVDFVLRAVQFVGEHGWRLLPLYTMNPETGEWRHRSHTLFKERPWLGHVSWSTGHMAHVRPQKVEKLGHRAVGEAATPEACLAQAETAAAMARQEARRSAGARTVRVLDDAAEDLRWFLYPAEATWWITRGESSNSSGVNGNLGDDGTTGNSSKGAASAARASSIMPGSPFVVGKVPIDSITHYKDSAHVPELQELYADALKEVQQLRARLAELEGASGEGGKIAITAATITNPTEKCEVKDVLQPAKLPTSTQQAQEAEEEETEAKAVVPPTHPHPATTAGPQEPEPEEELLFEPLAESESESESEGAASSGTDGSNPNPSVISSSHTSATFHMPPKAVLKTTQRAIQEFDMIRDGDRVLVCVSGGKDSLSLVHTLRQLQFMLRSRGINFTLGAATVDPGTPAYDPRPLIPYFEALGLPYFYESQGIVRMAEKLGDVSSICAFCSRMKRGRLYACARREGYNVLAFGQHLDDLAESFLMSTFHNGYLRTMKAHYTVADGDLRMVRPLCYTRERDLRAFAENAGLPVIAENCPACFEAPKERHRVKQLLAAQELLFPRLYHSLLSAMRPLMSKSRTGLERGIPQKGSRDRGGTFAPSPTPDLMAEQLEVAEEEEMEGSCNIGVGI